MSEDIQSTIEYFNNLSRQNPNDVDVTMNLAWVYQRAGDNQTAIDWFEKAISLDQNNAHAYHGLGLAYNGSGQVDRAIEAFQTALNLVEEIENRSERAVMTRQIEAYMRLNS